MNLRCRQVGFAIQGGMWKNLVLAILVLVGHHGSLVHALTIEVDYTYDSSQFFTTSGNPQGASGAASAKAALEAAAARWSAIIEQPLGALNLVDDNDDQRIKLSHPATGASWLVSSAVSVQSDSLVREGGQASANEYRGP